MTITDTTTVEQAQAAYDKAFAAAEKKGASYMQLSEFAERMGITRATLSNWRSRYDDFPAPALVCGSVQLFSRAAMAKYAAGLSADAAIVAGIKTGA